MSIVLDQVTKRYQGSPVVNDVSLEVGDGEFFVLLGPSGSGKSTLLRAIAGLTGVDHGRIGLHGRDVTHVSARERDVGLVFQNYALFRHMTVADNIEFALRIRRMKAAARRERRRELLRLVALEGMDERYPAQLSGGQQQRVAVARALAHKPEVLLLDEPFGALDAKIREELRRTIRQVQRELGITTILVTHDQEEAFALADRIGVMNHGRLLEVGQPSDLYARPATRFVATFLGAANLLLARQSADGVRIGGVPVRAEGGAGPVPHGREQEVIAVVRPEELEVAPRRELLASSWFAAGEVCEVVYTGAIERLRVRVHGDARSARHANGSGDDRGTVVEVSRTTPEQRAYPVIVGQAVVLGVRHVHLLPTPLSSFTALAAEESAAAELTRQPLLADLAERMKTVVTPRAEPGFGGDAGGHLPAPLTGVTAIAWNADAAKRAEWLIAHGAGEVLIVPPAARTPQRVLIHCNDEAARRATFAVAASLLRHVPAEAVYVGVLPPGAPAAQRAFGVRALLDARSEAQAAHGLEMRTELASGHPGAALARYLSEPGEQFLIVGVSDPGVLAAKFAEVLGGTPGWPVLVVHRPADPVRAAA